MATFGKILAFMFMATLLLLWISSATLATYWSAIIGWTRWKKKKR